MIPIRVWILLSSTRGHDVASAHLGHAYRMARAAGATPMVAMREAHARVPSLRERMGVHPGDKLDAYTSLGGYPLLYVTAAGETLCAACATEQIDDPDANDPPTAGDIHYEGPFEYCAACNEEIESAYGDPDAPEVDVTLTAYAMGPAISGEADFDAWVRFVSEQIDKRTGCSCTVDGAYKNGEAEDVVSCTKAPGRDRAEVEEHVHETIPRLWDEFCATPDAWPSRKESES